MNEINTWFDGYVCDSSHKEWLSPRRYYSAKAYGWKGKDGRKEFGKTVLRQIKISKKYEGFNRYA